MKIRYFHAQITRDIEAPPKKGAHDDDEEEDEDRQEDEEEDEDDDGDGDDEDEEDEDDGPFTQTFVASTADVDRMDDIVEQFWDLKDFLKNPVVLWAHRQDLLPVGRAPGTEVKDGKLILPVQFDTKHEPGKSVAEAVEDEFVNAVSVGFKPGAVQLRSNLPDDDPRQGESGVVFGTEDKPNILLEVSVLPVPAHGDALAVRDQWFASKGLPLPAATEKREGVNRAVVHRMVVQILKTDAEVRALIKGLALSERSLDAPDDELEAWFGESTDEHSDDNLSEWFQTD